MSSEAGSSKDAAAGTTSSQATSAVHSSLPAAPATAISPTATAALATDIASPAPANFCSLHIRLFDGSSIRSKFNADATLSTSVRTFVSANSSTDAPYNFRLMDMPRQNRTIEISEENQTLRELGLCPNATLVLVPVRDFIDAYQSNGATGVVQKGVSLGVNVVSSMFNVVGGVLGKVTGYQPTEEEAEGPYIAGTGDDINHLASKKEGKQPASPATDKPAIRVTTLADQRAKETPEYYNGNQLSVQPRPEDE
ncbi:hypothetical protein K461DRAFT_269889 [Myriangium duriaei CBS 260.36]|uniref:UBX domain-containing protein n=1 Tax=Myriangium duriaei CBS 260.36 TaxID=1168546 RepID=A0A9P4MER8_9PEZI|nr:hypothetical protein K461DRAFT_269889 [Myriangium duriaei CBS 260.36]